MWVALSRGVVYCSCCRLWLNNLLTKSTATSDVYTGNAACRVANTARGTVDGDLLCCVRELSASDGLSVQRFWAITVWRVNFEGGKFRGFREFYSILEILTTKVSNFSTIQFLHQLRHSVYVGIHEIHEPLVKLAHLTLVSSVSCHVCTCCL